MYCRVALNEYLYNFIEIFLPSRKPQEVRVIQFPPWFSYFRWDEKLQAGFRVANVSTAPRASLRRLFLEARDSRLNSPEGRREFRFSIFARLGSDR